MGCSAIGYAASIGPAIVGTLVGRLCTLEIRNGPSMIPSQFDTPGTTGNAFGTYCEYCEALGDCPLLQTHSYTRESYKASVGSLLLKPEDNLPRSRCWPQWRQWCWVTEDITRGKKLSEQYTICLLVVSEGYPSTGLRPESYLLYSWGQRSDQWTGRKRAWKGWWQRQPRL